MPDDDRDFITIEELKPVSVQTIPAHHSYQPSYYELSNVVEHPCSTTVYTTSQTLEASPNSLLELHTVDSSVNTSRKRKSLYLETSEDDTADDAKSVKTSDENKKQNHSEIEKRRRDKMNTYITELSSIVPMCHAMSRKLDKLTVLRMAVQHLKTLRGAVNSYTEGHYKPSFLSDQELKHLILQAADGFLFVVGCDRGRILYVSDSVSKVLNYSQGDLLGQSLFDILHPKDVAKVKEQLSSSDLNPRERLIDAKTMLPVKTDVPQGASRLCPGARRSFFCRMKCKLTGQIKEEADTTKGCPRRRNKQNSDKKYNVIQCTGYLKSWTPAKMGLEEQECEGDSCNLSCLVAIGRILPHISVVAAMAQKKSNVRAIQFVSRHALDGKFLFVDQRATLVLGFLPQELLGTSMYEYYHHDDIASLSDWHKLSLETSDYITTGIYRFKTKDGSFVRLQSEWKAFKNPWTKEVDYIIGKNILILSDFATVKSSGCSEEMQENIQFFPQSKGKEMHRIINNHIEAGKIGRKIAERVMDQRRSGGESSNSNSPSSEANSSPALQSTECQISTSVQNESLMVTSVPAPTIHEYTSPQHIQYVNVRSNISVSNMGNDSNSGHTSTTPIMEDRMMEMMEEAVRETPPNGPSTEGNDEAVMAVIMSLLEADAGLGGPVDFSGLPWPLP